MTDTEEHDRRVFGGRYEIQRKIARGGMADVYLARDQLLDRPVALKVLFPELSVDPSFVERFRREAQNAAKLSHPNVVSVYDWGEDESTYFIVMEYVDGRPLSVMLKEDGPVEPRRAAAIGADVAAALSFAHRNGVVHRDVKPGNVLIDNRGLVKVTDFGIARARNTTENLTQTGAVMGTATYFSPEQAQGLQVDQRSDVYSLGVVLYEMVGGRPPFQGDNPVSIAYKHVRESPVPLRQLNASVPDDFQAIVSRSMAKSASSRYATAEDFRADLERFKMGGKPEAAHGSADATQMVGAVGSPYATMTPPRPTPARPAAPPSRRGIAGPLMVFLALLAALAIGAIILFNTDFGSSKKDVIVPTVVNKQRADAESILRNVKLRPSVVTQQNAAEKGTVIAQDPAANATAKERDIVRLTVSDGPAPVDLPDVTNQTLETAKRTLQRLGFVVTSTEEASTSVERGRVIEQDPDPGGKLDKGATVALRVSSGPEQVPVPDVVGFTISRAASMLSDAGLRSSFPPGADSSIVASTDPAANTPVAKGTTVVLSPQVGPTSSSSSTTTTQPDETTSSTTSKPKN